MNQTDPTAADPVTDARDRLRGMALSLATGTGLLVDPQSFAAAIDAYGGVVRAAVLLDAAAECNKAGGAYAERGANDAAGAAFALMETFLQQAGAAEFAATSCSVPNVCEDGGEPCEAHERILGHIDGDHDLCAPDCGQEWLRRLAVEAHGTGTQQQEAPASTAPLANGLPLVQGNCPACRRASLFLGTGGYPTCSNWECPEPDAATTVLEQYANEAHPPQHTWRVETRDGDWVRGSHFLNRQAAVERYETANSTAPVWKDGTPVERRIVRETTTYTVEQPATGARQDGALS